MISVQPVMSQQIHQFHHLTPAEGLTSGKYNNYIHQDETGYVWISSTAGLNRFDGKSVRKYRREPGNPFSLNSELSAQSRFAERANGDLFFATGIGFSRYRPSTDDFRHYNLITAKEDTIRDVYLWCYLSPDDKDLFISGGRRLFRVDPDQPTKQTLLDDKFVCLKHRMYPLGERKYLLAYFKHELSELSLIRYDLATGGNQEEEFYLPEDRKVGDLRIIGPDSLLIATDRGLLGYNVTSKKWSLYPGTERLDIIEIETFGEKEIYLGTRQGTIVTYRHEEEKAEVLLNNNGSGVDTFRADVERLYVAPDGVLWVSTINSGVYYTDLHEPALNIQRIHRPGNSADVLGLTTDGSGRLYALFNGYVAVVEDDAVDYLELPFDGTGFNEGSGIFLDDEATLWVSTYRDLYFRKKDQDGFTRYPTLPNRKPDTPPGFFSPSYLPNGNLLLPTNASYPYYVNKSTGEVAPWMTSVSRIRAAVFDPAGHGILSTFQDSLHLISSQTGANPVRDTSIFGLGLVNGIEYDEGRKCFWVGSYAGLLRVGYDGSTGWWVRETGNILVDEAIISSLLLDEQQNVWFMTEEGVHRYTPDTDELSIYRLSDGAQASDFNLGVTGKLPDGELLFGGPQGINRIRPEGLAVDKEQGRLAITSVVINGDADAYRENLTDGDIASGEIGLRCPYTSRDIEIGLSAFDYKDPDNVRLFYSFNSRSEEQKFRPVPKTSVVDLFNLYPDDYELWVKGEDSYGREISSLRAASITILPPLYLTWWAYLIYILTILAIIATIIWQIISKEREKSARARAEVQTAETKTSILRLQMNPHFIFNSLNSIDDYILDEAPIKAHDYLVMFAELMRDILNRSNQPLTRLDQEIEMLEKYVEAERMRVGEGLRYTVKLEGGIDTVSTWIPTMILQPFVENAIWHGIGNREGGGLITLRFALNETDNCLVATVEDDGRGRGNAKGRTKKHASKALNITRQRMDLLNAKLATAPPTSPAPVAAPKKAYYEILDLTKEDGSPCGTKVVLYLPLIYPEDHESSSY